VQVGSAARPEPASLAETFTVTGEVLFQPFVPSGVWLTKRVGVVAVWASAACSPNPLTR